MDKLHVKPAEGRQVRREDGSIIPAEGAQVPNSTYYRRRIKDGDLVKVDSKTAKKGAE